MHSVSMQHWRKNIRQKWISRWVIAGLLFQVFLSAWHTPLVALTFAGASDPFSKSVVICTANGLRTITLDDSGEPIETPILPNYSKSCQICLSLAGSVAVVPDLPTLPSVEIIGTIPLKYSTVGPMMQDRRPYVRCGLDPPV